MFLKFWDTVFLNFDCLKSVAVALYQNFLLHNLAILSVIFLCVTQRLIATKKLILHPYGSQNNQVNSRYTCLISNIPGAATKFSLIVKCVYFTLLDFFVLRIKSHKRYYFCFITVIVTFLVCL